MKKTLLALFAVAALFAAGCAKQEETMVAPEATLPEVTEQAPVTVDTTTVPAPEAPAVPEAK